MSEKEKNVSWVTCPECGSKIGIFLTPTIVPPEVEKPAEKIKTIVLKLEEFRERLVSEEVDLSLLRVMEDEDKFIISPSGYLGEPWRPINDTIRSMGGQWISAGKESRWEIKKEVHA